MRGLFSALKTAGTMALLGAGLVATGGAAAQNWEPTKPFQVIIPYPAGGGPDSVFNIINPELTKRLGQNFVLVHRPGGLTVIGTQAIARAAPDGYTMGIATDQLVINQLLMNNLPYKADDVIPLTQLIEGYFIVVSGTQNPALNSLAGLIREAKANPDKYTYATPGNGSPHHLVFEALSQAAGIKLKMIPYQGSPQMATDVLGGHVNLMLSGAVSALEYARTGRMVPLAAISPQRLPFAQTIPTAIEGGVNFASSFWYGLIMPKGVPANVMARLSREYTAVLSDPEVQKRINGVYLLAKPGSPDDFAGLIKRDQQKYEKVIAQSKIKM